MHLETYWNVNIKENDYEQETNRINDPGWLWIK